MNLKNLKNFITSNIIIVLVIILTLGFLLRSHNLYTWPREGATFDEFAWTWLGINLIQTGVPVSWSPHPQYQDKEHLIYRGAAFWLVKPYLEHPPLFGLVAGSFSMLAGARDMHDVTLQKIRPLALALGIFSILMIFLLTKELYGSRIALLASLLYATVPTIVIGSRIVQNENFLIPFWLLALYLLTRYIKSGKKKFRNIAAVIAGLLSLAKVPWLAVGLSLSMILAFNKKLKDALFVGGITLAIFSLFMIYGIYFDKELFFNLWGLQLNRYDLGFSSIYALFQKPYLADRFFLDGWIYFGWFSMFLLFKDVKKYAFVVLPFIAYFLVFLAGIPDEPGHGWYRYPFYPFLVIAIALFIRDHFVRNPVLTFIFLTFVGTALFHNTWAETFGFSYPVFRLAIIGWSMVLLPLFIYAKNINKGVKVVSYFWILILIFMNIWSILIFNDK
jgi:4-amino-4-deoxy-L-arabinose transferase-like glycosyltransferase